MDRRGAAGVLGVAVLLALTGCSVGRGASEIDLHVIQTYRGTAVSRTTSSSSDAHPTVYWIAGRHEIAFSGYGSSSCPPVPVSADVVSATRVSLRMRDYGSGGCTADLAATTTEFAAPSTLSRSATVLVTLEAAGYTPSTLQLRPDPTVTSRPR